VKKSKEKDETMPYEKCVEYKGKIYCWNPETKKINKIAVEDVDIEKCPLEVLSGLMTILGGTVEKISRKEG
jgi:hypothetical protein